MSKVLILWSATADIIDIIFEEKEISTTFISDLLKKYNQGIERITLATFDGVIKVKDNDSFVFHSQEAILAEEKLNSLFEDMVAQANSLHFYRPLSNGDQFSFESIIPKSLKILDGKVHLEYFSSVLGMPTKCGSCEEIYAFLKGLYVAQISEANKAAIFFNHEEGK